MPPVTVETVPGLLDGRAGLRLHAQWGHVSVLLGGGHICELTAHTHPGVNPLWRPQWTTIDPGQYHPERHHPTYGPPPDGRLLAGIAGHNISFDHFGPPSAEETAAGLSTHGEGPAVGWQLQRELDFGIEYGATLPVAQIDFRRTLRLDPDHPVVYCGETARNLSAADRPICWNEHVTVGPPFLECGATFVDMPATRAQVIQASYSDAMVLVPDAQFDWPIAPTQSGSTHDLRTTPEGRYCRYTIQLLDPALEFAWTAIANPSKNLLLLYVFRRADFPWVGNWEERFHHTNPPWGGKTFCRGVEFSTTPWAIPKRETVTAGPVFGERTYRWLPAQSQRSVRYLALLLTIPRDFAGVDRLSLASTAVHVEERGTGRIFSQPVDASFLARPHEHPLD
jgi:hypothetical protein